MPPRAGQTRQGAGGPQWSSKEGRGMSYVEFVSDAELLTMEGDELIPMEH
jgi:hypothetical protein